ncbi:MAG: PorV/PorQ family protein [candidate division Zixibacteria bacterium]|mgnify:CR=1 FL=1|nr:PorV/PorQ family protein [candidate division Zixibacteria bacterium]
MKLAKYSFIVLAVFTAVNVSAQQQTKVGSAGAQFLKIGVGSRYQAMGEAAVAQANDIYALYWNPAGLASLENGAVSFTNVNWVADLDLNYVAIAKNFEDAGVFGVSAMVLSGADQEITTFEAQTGTGQMYSTTSYAVGLTFARQLTAKFAFGATAKYVGEKIHLVRSSGIAFDFGTMLYTGFKTLRMGMSITNMGPQLQFSGPTLTVPVGNVDASLKTTPYSLPLAFKVGLAYDIVLGSKAMASVSAELKHPDDNLQQGAVGTEIGFDDKFFLRAGYKINYEEEALSLGGGLITKVTTDTKLAIDYSWQDFGRLESAQKFSIGFIF